MAIEENLEYQMTQEGYDKLVEELEHYKKIKRPEVIEKIKVARSFGDLSENSEYDAAKDEQGFIEQKILEMEQMIRYAKIIEIDDKSNTIRLGHTVTYVELPDGVEESYKIVGSAEANPFEYKISNESPVAQALLGKEVGDVVKVSLPTGPEDSMDIKIIKVK
nr:MULTISPECIES: transcription elongation factor GreA [unclassified Gemella]